MRKLNTINFRYFFLKREFYYHKIQYSKVLKHDISAAIFGIVFGAFAVYLSLNTLGSGSPDLSDLSVFLWYVFLAITVVNLLFNVFKFKYSFFRSLLFIFNFIVFNLLI